MANAIVGTLVLLGLGRHDRNADWCSGRRLSGRIRIVASQLRWIRFVADVLNGVPSITWGMVVYALVVILSKLSPLTPAAWPLDS